MSFILSEDMGLRSLPTPVTRKKCALSPVIIGMFAVVVSFPDYVLCLIFGSSLAVYHVKKILHVCGASDQSRTSYMQGPCSITKLHPWPQKYFFMLFSFYCCGDLVVTHTWHKVGYPLIFTVPMIELTVSLSIS